MIHQFCKRILKSYCPQDTFEYIVDKNPSKDVPYHNAMHEALVVQYCYEGMRAENIWEEISLKDMKTLILAAAFHDFDHTAGVQTDDFNILRACAGLRSAELNLTNEERMDAILLIRITQYPYVYVPLTPIEKILRDADLMMLYAPEDIKLMLFRGLRIELAAAGKVLTDEEYIAGLRDFYSKIKWQTNWAQSKAKQLDFSRLVEKLCKSLIT